jgi:hypothetical protein
MFKWLQQYDVTAWQQSFTEALESVPVVTAA